MRKGRIRRKSKKRAAVEREAQPVFDEFFATFAVCWLCRAKPTSEVHHLCSGAFKAKTYGDRRGFFATCRQCHELLGDRRKIPLTVQIATKRLRDPEFYDLAWINMSRGKAPNAITEQEVSFDGHVYNVGKR